MSTNSDTRNMLKDVFCTVIGLLLGLALLGSGIYGIVSGRIEKRNYRNSDDIRRVTAVVVDYEDVTDDDSDYYEFRVKLRFVVDGKSYYAKDTVFHRAYTGDEETIEVYRTPKGDYKLPPDGNPFHFLLYCIAIPIGAVVTLAMAANIFIDDPKPQEEQEAPRRITR